MSSSVEELDNTVRTFYEGRGEIVRTSPFFFRSKLSTSRTNLMHSKSKLKTPLIRYMNGLVVLLLPRIKGDADSMCSSEKIQMRGY